MTVSGISNVASTHETVTSTSNETVGRDDFLSLLVTQLKNQDPLDPMESAEFSAQLAQFSSLEQLTQMNDGMERLIQQQSEVGHAQAVNFVGKDVTARGDTIQVKDGEVDKFGFELADDASNVTIYISDSLGRLVNTIEKGNFKAGEHSFEWEGTDQWGNPEDDGLYTFEVVPMDRDGNLIEATTTVTAHITGISFEGQSTVLLAGDRGLLLKDIIKVVDPETEVETADKAEDSPGIVDQALEAVGDLLGDEDIRVEEPASGTST